MKDNENNYSDSWQPYTGDYDKFEYDIKLHDGTIIPHCYPNARKFNSFTLQTQTPESEVAEIKFSEKPVTELNWYVSPQCKEWLLSDEAKEQEMHAVQEEEKRKAQVGGRKMGMINSVLAAASAFGNFEYLDYGYFPKSNNKKLRGQVVGVRTEPKIRRNEKCPCGSGQKYKKCCINKSTNVKSETD